MAKEDKYIPDENDPYPVDIFFVMGYLSCAVELDTGLDVEECQMLLNRLERDTGGKADVERSKSRRTDSKSN